MSALPRTLILLLLFLTAFVWISSILMLLLAVRLKWIFWDLSQSFSLRLAITVFTIVLLYSVGQVNVVSACGIMCTRIITAHDKFNLIFYTFSLHVYRIIHAQIILQMLLQLLHQVNQRYLIVNIISIALNWMDSVIEDVHYHNIYR